MSNEDPYDFIGVGLGPFNLGLACLADPLPGVRSLFLEKKRKRSAGTRACSWTVRRGRTRSWPILCRWQDPTSRFSYLNYCKQQGRIYNYCIRENFT